MGVTTMLSDNGAMSSQASNSVDARTGQRVMSSLGPYLACSPAEDLQPSRVRRVFEFKTKVKNAKKASSW